uniref:THAP domain-containing protein 11 n=1 Tax=Pelusios castaneus TaxID=367368 RepID=A0A8C8RFX1_9SAUR
MPGFTCCVPGCYNNSHRDKALHFYTFPKDPELRRLWLKNVSRADLPRLLVQEELSLCCDSICKTLVDRTHVTTKWM